MSDWRGDLLERLRGIIMGAEPDIVEEVKWRKRRRTPTAYRYGRWAE